MTLFKILLQSTGLSLREAAAFLDVSYDSVKDWLYGRRPAPQGAIEEIIDLMDTQAEMAQAVLDLMDEHPAAGAIEIGYCADDNEARGLGLPCKSAHDAAIRRIVENCEDPSVIKLVPRGSTLASAASEI